MKKLTAALVLLAGPALAHHPLAGAPMETFAQGMLSGVGHPILGFDHLFFVALVGIAALFTGHRFSAPVAYLAAMLAGVAVAGSLPLAEFGIAASLLVLGGVVLSGRTPGLALTALLFAGFGLFHGAGLGGALAEQESVNAAVLSGYLLGLFTVQYAIALGAGFAAERLGASTAQSLNARLTGAAVAGVGGFLVLEALEGPALSLLF